jgi:hypothetical protein
MLSMLSSCDDTMDVTFKFTLSYGEEPLVMLEEYEYPSGETLKFTRLSFYVSELEGISNSGTSTLLKDIDLINLSSSHATIEGADEGLTYTIKDIPSEEFESYAFLLGVASDLNSKVPADYASDHPLANSGEYWIAWDSYIFLKIEGIMDTDGDSEFETNVALHIGSDEASRQIRMSSVDPSNEQINIDVKSIFESNGTLYDLQENPQIHSLFQLDQASFLVENLAQQLRK